MNLYNVYFNIFAVLLIVGGFIGYKKSGSKISMYSGLLFGIIILNFLHHGITCPDMKWNYVSVAAASSILSITFLIRTLKTKKMMPSGMLLVLSIIGVIIALMQIV